MKHFIILISTCISLGSVNAQNWSREDSMWLRNVLEGKEELEINEDTKKAIDEGVLIVPSWMKKKEHEIKNQGLLTRDFDEAKAKDSARLHNIDPYSMPPAVFALYVLYIDKMDSINNARTELLSADDRKKLEEIIPTGIKGILPPDAPQVVSGIGGLDFNGMLSMVFSPLYRRKKYNAKHAIGYKNYYDNGAERSVRLTEKERKALRRSVNLNMAVEKMANPIDD